MSKLHGLKHFSDFFKEFQDDYVIIGGGAAAEYLGDEGLNFRTTEDVDMVLFTNESNELNAKISDYISEGEYQTNERTEDSPRHYRFSNPQQSEFPKIIEIFARVDKEISLKKGQYIIPIQNDENAKISAILLDDEYFELIKNNSIKSEKGYSIISPQVNICLKARAYRELSERNESKDKINKHLSDIIRLTQVLDGSFVEIVGQPFDDIKSIIDEISNVDKRRIKQIIGTTLSKQDVDEVLNKTFIIKLW